MPVLHQCPECGTALPGDAPEGLCPSCLLQSGLAAEAPSDGYHGPFVPPAPAELTRLFPQLEILELLGQGGMGAVYKARQRKLDRLVALKVLPPSLCKDPAFAERFAREARALARLCHPNIVAVHDFGEVEGLYYFLMEYVDGANLRQVLLTGRLMPPEALRIVPQICEALQYAHEEGVVHRDIKPENILLDQKGRVKVADFGLAKLAGPTPGTFTLTGSRQVVGTPHYMAPEQMERPHAVDHRADIYSLGVVLYEMLTGELPLGRFALPSHKAAVDGRMDDVVLRALAKEPEQRFQRVSEVKDSLEDLGGARAVPAARSGRQLCIPYWHYGDTYNVKVYGLLRWDGAALTLEMEVLETESSWFDSKTTKTVREREISLSDLQSIQFHSWSWWLGQGILLRGRRLSVLTDVPGSTHGQLALYLTSDQDRADAEALVAQVTARLHGTPAPASPRAETPETDKSEPPPRRVGRLRGKLRSFVQAARYWMVDSLAMPREPSRLSEPATVVRLPEQPQAGPVRRFLGNTVGNSTFWAILICLVGVTTLFMPWSSIYSSLGERHAWDGNPPWQHRVIYLTPDGKPLQLPKDVSLGKLYQHVPGLRGSRSGFFYEESMIVSCLFGGLALLLIITSALRSPGAWRGFLMIPCGVGVLIAAGVFLVELPSVPRTIYNYGRMSDVYARRLGLTMNELHEAINQVVPYLDLWPNGGPFAAIGLAVALLLLGSLQLRGLVGQWQRAESH